MVRMVAGFFISMMIAAAAIGCGSGVSEDDAKLRCDQEKTNNASACIDDAAYAQCMSCEQECGDHCVRMETCPTQFTCPK